MARHKEVETCFELDAARNPGNSITGYLKKLIFLKGRLKWGKAVTGKEVKQQLLT